MLENPYEIKGLQVVHNASKCSILTLGGIHLIGKSTAHNSYGGQAQKETFSVVSDLTGEVKSSGNEKVTTSNGKVCRESPEHARLYVHSLERLVDLQLDRREYDVFLLCVRYALFENQIDATQFKIAARLKMRPEHVSKAFKTLLQNGLIYLIISEGGKKTYCINGDYLWKGSEKRRTIESKRRRNEFLNDAVNSMMSP